MRIFQHVLVRARAFVRACACVRVRASACLRVSVHVCVLAYVHNWMRACLPCVSEGPRRTT